jgi:hypothetical protein
MPEEREALRRGVAVLLGRAGKKQDEEQQQ